MVALTTDQIKAVAELIMQRDRKTTERLATLPAAAQREWIDEAYEAEEGFNAVSKVLREDGIEIKISERKG